MRFDPLAAPVAEVAEGNFGGVEAYRISFPPWTVCPTQAECEAKRAGVKGPYTLRTAHCSPRSCHVFPRVGPWKTLLLEIVTPPAD